MIKISRPCYDKYRRCPGWAGAGWKYNRRDWCHDGMASWEFFELPRWTWRWWRCIECGTLVLPYNARYLDPRWWRHWTPRRLRWWPWR